MDEERNYWVVFEYTKEVPDYEGKRIIVPYINEEELIKLHTPEREKREKIIAKGVTYEEGTKICGKTLYDETEILGEFRKLSAILERTLKNLEEIVDAK